ncbi:winged helix-turn-helix transcriptional regulator [Nocardia salmonicida]|uniref:winged helix-turn-helix transcriptional regulator n=1 Tax=Nocardia salmonicida TaxID=53431 RepID=UPI0009EDFBE3
MFIGDKWTVPVIMTIHQGGVVRFSVIQRILGDISSKLLASTLKKLEREGFIRRDATPTVPVSVEYQLTELGRSFEVEVLRPMGAWARRSSDAIESSRDSFDMPIK